MLKGTRMKKQAFDEEKILKQFDKLIIKIAHKTYVNYNFKYALEDLLQEAKVGCILAYRKYDPNRNCKLITHLHNYINFHLSHYLRADTGLIRIPSRVMADPEKKKPEFSNNEFLYENSSDSGPMTFDNIDDRINIEEFLSILTDRQKDIIKKIYLEGYTYDEVANLYNISRQAANFDATKGIKKIQERFATEMI
jgi:RNA polymerase sigma factor (sigma-70 family)